MIVSHIIENLLVFLAMLLNSLFECELRWLLLIAISVCHGGGTEYLLLLISQIFAKIVRLDLSEFHHLMCHLFVVIERQESILRLLHL